MSNEMSCKILTYLQPYGIKLGISNLDYLIQNNSQFEISKVYITSGCKDRD